MAIPLNDNLRIRAPKITDQRSAVFSGGQTRPYSSKAEVDALLNINERSILLVVYIQTETDARPVPYWFYGGLGVNNLEPVPGGSGGGSAGGFEWVQSDEEGNLLI